MSCNVIYTASESLNQNKDLTSENYINFVNNGYFTKITY